MFILWGVTIYLEGLLQGMRHPGVRQIELSHTYSKERKRKGFEGQIPHNDHRPTGETAQIGNARDLGNVYNLKSSVSAGLGWDVVLFEHVNIKFSTFSAKALEANRTPVFYFILTAYTYLFV